jgi:aliphatic nitrilase
MAGLLSGGLCTAIVSPDGAILAGPPGEGEELVVAEIDLSAIAARKMLLDTVGHYSRPDLVRLSLDDTPRRCVEPMAPAFEGRGESNRPGAEDVPEVAPE